MLAGLMTPDAGQIIVEDATWLDTRQKINLRPQHRKVGLVFQDYALFPNMTVRENLLFALSKHQDKTFVDELIEIVELQALQDRKPESLSGGQKQRVALARALVQRPKLLLLDEPLSALDIEMRRKLQSYILKVHQEFGLTTILVSHDLSEILKMSDKVIILEEGKIIRQGSPTEVFARQNEKGKFQLTGEVVAIKIDGKTTTLTILIGKDLIEVLAKETENFQPGDQVLLSTDIFNPTVQKIT